MGGSCRCPAVRGKARCRLHGGRSTGVRGEANGAYRHGGRTKEAEALQRRVRKLLAQLKERGFEVDDAGMPCG
ncbi:HGGxSTG domain-containing protein [Sphingomonas tabacisoli]|uniref:HGGxSTG domain-containing protein n=1 Tax=Sphingomonas tabacisoli TaxID=2249466 RepID=A0ABW4I0U1_9SPHN